jgi:hydroxyacylglutathione hydrolase
VINVKLFVFNPFQENTYLLSDNTGECVIIDAGCYFNEEFEQLINYISTNKLIPVRLLNTHGHIDHILGISRLSEYYHLIPEFHKDELYLINDSSIQGKLFGIDLKSFNQINTQLEENKEIAFGQSKLNVLLVPGHTKGSVAFVSPADKFVLTGDVLFKDTIGRTDLPGGDFNVLLNSITNKLLKLSDDTIIYPGHGPTSTIGEEKVSNPFLV